MLHFSEAAVNRTRTFRLSVMLHAGRCASEKKKKKKKDDADQTDNVQPETSDACINERRGDGAAIGQRAAQPQRRYGVKKLKTPCCRAKTPPEGPCWGARDTECKAAQTRNRISHEVAASKHGNGIQNPKKDQCQLLLLIG